MSPIYSQSGEKSGAPAAVSLLSKLLLLLFLALAAGCGDQPPGTARMAKELAAFAEQAEANPMPFYLLNSRRAEIMREQAGKYLGRDALQFRAMIAKELLQAGQTEAAIAELLQIMDELGEKPTIIAARNKQLFEELAIAYLRLGEQQNCIDNHNEEACILPIAGAGVQARQEGTRQAIALYEQILSRYKGDFGSRWLLNIAYSAIGAYPDSVPEDFLIKGLEPRPGNTFPRFPNIALSLGLAVNGLSGGLCIEDFNGDGHLDLFMTSYGLKDLPHLFLADGMGGYVDHTARAGLQGLTGGLNTIHADYDNDGDADIFILRGGWLADAGTIPNSLLRNNGDGTFEDVTQAAGLLSRHPTQTAAWADFDLDGHLDLFIGNESRTQWQNILVQEQTASAPPHPCELYHNNGDGTFTEIAQQAGIGLKTFVKGVAWGDVNNDGLPDLFVAVLGEPNRLYLNRGGAPDGGWRFEEKAGEAGLQAPLFSFPAWFWDYDNDGWEDLFVSSFDLRQLTQLHTSMARECLGLSPQAEPAALYRNNGDGTFTDVAPALGLDKAFFAMGSNFGDLDNDGWLDFYLGNGSPDLRSVIPNRMFRNIEGRSFDEVTYDGGFGHIQKGHALAFADLDRDGDEDIYAVMGGAYEGDVFPNVLFENPGGWGQNAWVRITLEGRTANRSAIGARLELEAEGPGGATHRITRTVGTGGSFGAGSLQQEIGLGQAARIRSLRIAWPNTAQTVEIHRDMAVNRFYRIVEGEAPQVLERVPVPFRKEEGAGHSGHGHR